MDDSSQQPATQHCTTDHDDHRTLLSHDEVLSCVQNWLGCSADIRLVTEAPILLWKKKQKNASDGVSQPSQRSIAILRIDNPQTLPNILDDAVLPYVCRAFDQDISTVDPTILQEHKDHLTKGNVLFCAVQVAAAGDEESMKTSRQDKVLSCRRHPRFVAHLLVSMIAIDGGINTTNDASRRSSTPDDKKKNAMCVVGRVCDPDWQHQGISTHVQSTSLKSLQPDIIVTRTANPAIFKLLRKVSAGKSLLLYPHDCQTENDWSVARQLGNHVVTAWDHLRSDIGKYDADRLVFRNLYSSVNQKIFDASTGGEDDDAPFLQPGDAALCVLVL